MLGKTSRIYRLFIISTSVFIINACNTVPEPEPLYPIPTERQMEWQEMEFYGFLHFSINTFTDDEWGYGDKSPFLFNPTELNARQWARIAKEAGMKGLILTNKHHDGFCLWPSKYTEYSVKNSPWKEGKGDVVKELAEACREYGLKMGVYLSPWDRNHADYGKPEYITYFRNQLTELLTNYGDIFEVWFDGANGGDGYYGGARETRRVDKKTYYDWENTNKMIRKIQPNTIIWSNSGPDARWVGNEHGYSHETTWSPLVRDSIYGGMPNYHTKYAMGQEHGTHWVPAEADVSIRPSWYYHEYQDERVKSLNQLLDIYYKSVGQNSTLLLNIPIDRRGLVHENDEKQLKKMVNQLKQDFAVNLAKNANITTTSIRGDSKRFIGTNIIDGDKDTYWTTDDGVNSGALTIAFKQPTEINRLLIQEYIRLGQRVKKFSVEVEIEDEWKTIATKTTIGYKRILRFENVIATKVRVNIEDSKACPLISNIEIYNAPVIVDIPVISRNKQGVVTMTTPQPGVDVYYSLDETTPDLDSKKYENSFEMHSAGTIKAFSIDPKTNRQSDVVEKSFSLSKINWQIVGPKDNTALAIDDNPKTEFTFKQNNYSNGIIIDLGEQEAIKGFTYLPTQRKHVKDAITHYELYGSVHGNDWNLISKGEFSNIMANPIEQKVNFDSEHQVQFIKLKPTKIMHDSNQAIIAEIGVIQ